MNNNHLRSNTGEVEWYTPKRVVDEVVAAMGTIGLDPASCEVANTVVGAQRYYTQEDDGLSLLWIAETVFCNPPYGRAGLTGVWYDKMLNEWKIGNFREGMFLANSTTEVKWFQHALRHFPIRFFAGRLKFWNPSRPDRNGILGSVMIYMPPRFSPLSVPPNFFKMFL